MQHPTEMSISSFFDSIFGGGPAEGAGPLELRRTPLGEPGVTEVVHESAYVNFSSRGLPPSADLPQKLNQKTKKLTSKLDVAFPFAFITSLDRFWRQLDAQLVPMLEAFSSLFGS